MREYVRNFPNEFNGKGEPICPVPKCNEICMKFKNGNWRRYCDLHDSYSLQRERYWGLFKQRILTRDRVCVKCGGNDELQVDHILAIVNGGEMWDEKNLQTLCYNCHKKKTKKDLQTKKKLKQLK